jgi:hypothetical protein
LWGSQAPLAGESGQLRALTVVVTMRQQERLVVATLQRQEWLVVATLWRWEQLAATRQGRSRAWPLVETLRWQELAVALQLLRESLVLMMWACRARGVVSVRHQRLPVQAVVTLCWIEEAMGVLWWGWWLERYCMISGTHMAKHKRLLAFADACMKGNASKERLSV